MFVPRQPCQEPRCTGLHGVVSDRPVRGPAKPYTGPRVSPRRDTATALRSPGEDPTAHPLSAVGVLSEAAERPSTSGPGA